MSNPLKNENILSIQAGLHMDTSRMPLIVNGELLTRLREAIAKRQNKGVQNTLYLNDLADFMQNTSDFPLQGLALTLCEHMLMNKMRQENVVAKLYTCRLVGAAFELGLAQSRELDSVLSTYLAHLKESLNHSHANALQSLSSDYAAEILRHAMEVRFDKPTPVEGKLLELVTHMRRHHASHNQLYDIAVNRASKVLFDGFNVNNEYLYRIYQQMGGALLQIHKELVRAL